MDGISLNAGRIARPGLLGGGAASGGVANEPGLAADAMRFSAAARTAPPAPMYGTAGPAGGAAPTSADALIGRLEADARQAQSAGDSVKSARLVQTAYLVRGVAGDPALVAQLNQAYVNPRGSESATRLSELIFGDDPNPTQQLLGMLAFDGRDADMWRRDYPKSAFQGSMTGSALAIDVLREVASPAAIKQGNRQTCGATCVEIMLAREAPREYLRLVTSLAVLGEATMQNGQALTRAADWSFGGDGGRSLSSRLLQPSLMDYANAGATYDNTQDQSVDGGTTRPGLLATEMKTLLSGVTTRETQMTEVQRWNGSGWGATPGAFETALAKLKEMADKGWSAPVLLTIKPSQAFGHYQMITHVDAEGVTALNPWGYEERIPMAQFRDRLVAAFYQ